MFPVRDGSFGEEVLDALTIALICAAFLIGGGVKGMLGLGLPLTSVALMSTFLDLRVAIPLLVIPVIVTNIWQAFRGDQMAAILRRYWVLFACSCLGIWLGTLALFRVDPSWLITTLGVVVCVFTVINLFALRVSVPAGARPFLSPAVGLFSGVLSGTTGSLGAPVMMYFQALGMPRDTFVQALGLQFLITAAVWLVALVEQGALRGPGFAISTLAVAPAALGMVAGQWLRNRLTQERFNVWVYAFLFIVGLNLIRKGIF